MRRLLALFALTLALSSSAHATWTLGQHRSNVGCGGTSSCAVTGFTAVTAGSLIVGIGYATSGGVGATGASGGGTWVIPSGCAGTSTCAATDTTAGAVFVEYVLASTGAPTTLTIFSGSLSIEAAEILTYTYTAGTISFDVGGSADTVVNCTTCAGITLSPTANDVIVQAVSCSGTCATSASAGFVGASPYTNPADFPTGDGAGGAINQSTGTAPNWSMAPTGHVAILGIAFKENSAVTCHNRMALMGAGCS